MSHASNLFEGSTYTGDVSLYRGKVGLVCFFVAEAHMFGVLVISYLVYLNQSLHSDTPPSQVLKLWLAIVMTICLLGSSGTIVLALSALQRGTLNAFYLWWAVTVGLALLFLGGTAYDWWDLIGRHGLTLGRNLFGTTYFSLIGLHATHVTIGALLMLVLLGVAWWRSEGSRGRGWSTAAELLSWYWHFVDGVWVVIFCVVYLYGR